MNREEYKEVTKVFLKLFIIELLFLISMFYAKDFCKGYLGYYAILAVGMILSNYSFIMFDLVNKSLDDVLDFDFIDMFIICIIAFVFQFSFFLMKLFTIFCDIRYKRKALRNELTNDIVYNILKD